MKLSTKGRYGLRAIADLALHDKGKPIPLSQIAERQDLSEGYLESMFGALRRAGLVRSIKGAFGGYLLAKPASVITVEELLKVLEGDLAIIDEDEKDNNPESLRFYIKQNVWNVVSDRLSEVVSSLTLEDLITCRSDDEAVKKGQTYAD